MDVANAGLGVLATVSVLVVAALLPLLGGRPAALQLRAAALAGAAGMFVVLLLWMTGVTGIPSAFAPPVVALGGLFAVVATLDRFSSALRAAVVAAALSILVFVPLAMVAFGVLGGFLFTSTGLLDLGAALPALVGAGSAAGAFSVLDRRQRARPSTLSWPMLWLLPVLWGAWIGWLVGFELAIDQSTPIIAENTVLLPAAALVAGVAMERIRHRTNTPAGTAIALVGGLAAATPACAYLEPALAVVVGLAVGAVVAILPVRDWPNRLGLTLAVAAAIGLILLGLLAQDLSFIYTGQPELTYGQLGAVTLAAGLAFCAVFVVSLVERRIRRPACWSR